MSGQLTASRLPGALELRRAAGLPGALRPLPAGRRFAHPISGRSLATRFVLGGYLVARFVLVLAESHRVASVRFLGAFDGLLLVRFRRILVRCVLRVRLRLVRFGRRLPFVGRDELSGLRIARRAAARLGRFGLVVPWIVLCVVGTHV